MRLTTSLTPFKNRTLPPLTDSTQFLFPSHFAKIICDGVTGNKKGRRKERRGRWEREGDTKERKMEERMRRKGEKDGREETQRK